MRDDDKSFGRLAGLFIVTTADRFLVSDHGVRTKTDKKLVAAFLLVPAIYVGGTGIALAVFG